MDPSQAYHLQLAVILPCSRINVYRGIYVYHFFLGIWACDGMKGTNNPSGITRTQIACRMQKITLKSQQVAIHASLMDKPISIFGLSISLGLSASSAFDANTS